MGLRDGMERKEFNDYVRQLVVGVNERVPLLNGSYSTAINFDNAATTPPFHCVLRKIEEFCPWYSSVHRGTGYKSVTTSDWYEAAREEIKAFVHADEEKDILIYTKSTTEAINVLAHTLSQQDGRTVVLSSEMEHLANDLPWRNAFTTDYVAVDRSGRLVLANLEKKLRQYGGSVKLVAVTGASNVTGYMNPIHQIAAICHQYGAQLLVDGAQLVPHCPVDMKPHSSREHIDFLVFSAHKMYAPFGVGILIGPRKAFHDVSPLCKGGGAVKLVGRQFVDWDDSPYKEEAGTPNVIGVVALVAAIRLMTQLDVREIHDYERELTEYIMTGLSEIPGIRLFGRTRSGEDRVSLFSFQAEGLDHRAFAKMLSYEAGIAVRSGLFCAHPYVENLLGVTEKELNYYHKHQEARVPGLVRVSLGVYNTCREADVFLETVGHIIRHKDHYKQKYEALDSQAGSGNVPFWVKRHVP
ncbi:aminotransferase class V-fold PLP-dependent enzyme [Propionispora vibrioides]|nr:aminotransferase class V-fold PLP-dependent enzyme [Propionispora vibrioides]